VDSCADADVVVSRNARAPTSRVRDGFINVLLSGRPATMDELGGRYYQKRRASILPARGGGNDMSEAEILLARQRMI